MLQNSPVVYLEDHPLKHFEKGKITKILLLTSEQVGKLYLTPMTDFFSFKGIEVISYVVDTKEKTQDFTQVSKIYDILNSHHFQKTDGIVALGGMSLQEIAGFVAGSYLGGLDFFSLPTSFLSQLKMLRKEQFSLNFFKRGNITMRNCPKTIFIEPFFLETLKDNEMKNGYAYLALQGVSTVELFDLLGNDFSLKEWVETFKSLDISPVSLNPNLLYQGLNIQELSGTFSYWETVSAYLQLLTGETEKRKFSEKGTLEKINSILDNFSLNFSITEDLLEDGDYGNQLISLQYLKKIGEISTMELTTSALQQWFY